MIIEEKPLVSFVVLAYNQEEYIQDAVISALSQNYFPLEIIISDDCSSDNTYQIIEDVVRDLGGCKKIIVNRNSENLGTVCHLNKLIKIASGEFIVLAGGDDISLPIRTNFLINKWIGMERKICSIFTNAIVIDQNGKEHGKFFNEPIVVKNIDEFISIGNCWLGGFSHGFPKILYEKYGPIKANTFQEDGVLSFRALLNNGIFYYEDCTVLYRRHQNNSYDTTNFEKLVKLYKSELELTKQRIFDLELDKDIDSQRRLNVKK
ncbi:glycosyltransferase, partial [Limnohabitans sp.]